MKNLKNSIKKQTEKVEKKCRKTKKVFWKERLVKKEQKKKLEKKFCFQLVCWSKWIVFNFLKKLFEKGRGAQMI